MPTACGAILALRRLAKIRLLVSRREGRKSSSVEDGQRPAVVFRDEDRQQLRPAPLRSHSPRRDAPCPAARTRSSLAERAGRSALELRAQPALEHEGRDRAGMPMSRRIGIRRKPDERRGDRMPRNVRQFFAGQRLDRGGGARRRPFSLRPPPSYGYAHPAHRRRCLPCCLGQSPRRAGPSQSRQRRAGQDFGQKQLQSWRRSCFTQPAGSPRASRAR